MAEQNEASPDWVRIALRMTPRQRDLLRRAADVAGMPVSAFVLRSACQTAEQLLVEQQPGSSSLAVESLSRIGVMEPGMIGVMEPVAEG
jgi:uncharacterized protein (DUF1778 family)